MSTPDRPTNLTWQRCAPAWAPLLARVRTAPSAAGSPPATSTQDSSLLALTTSDPAISIPAISNLSTARPFPPALSSAARGKRRMVDFSSNDYLCLPPIPHSGLLRPSLRQPKDLFPFGPPSSRLLDRHSREHKALERQLVNFLKGPDQECRQTLDELDQLPIPSAPTSRWLVSAPRPQPLSGLLFNSGFDANLSVFATLPAPDDYVLYDALIHASTHDGMRASRVPPERRRAFAHSDVADLAAHVERIRDADDEVRAGRRGVWIAVEALYSMDGDVCPLREMVEVVEELLPRGNGMMVVDEAHSTGLYGREGRGLVSWLGLEERVAVRVATFGKAVAASGGELARARREDVVAVREMFRYLEAGEVDEVSIPNRSDS